MTSKFDNLVSDMDKIASQTKTIKTRGKARELSLKKWKTIREMNALFFSEFTVRCGFCGYGEHKAEKVAGSNLSRCACCGVKTICDKMLAKASELHEQTDILIDELISHFENMKVAP